MRNLPEWSAVFTDNLEDVQNKDFTGNGKEFTKVSRARQKSRKSFTLTMQWDLANLVNIYHGIIALQHAIDPRRMGIAERAVRRVLEGTFSVLLQWGLGEKWWADSKECCCYLRNVLDLLADRKTPYERRFGEPFKGQIIPYAAMVEYHPIPVRDQSRLHQFGENVIPGIFSRARIDGGIMERRHSDCGRFGKVGRIYNLSSNNQRERCIDITKTR